MSGYESEHFDSPPPLRICGRVKWFDVGKGYGFIVPDDPSQTDLKDVLLHVTSLRTSGRETCLEGSLITCDVVRRPKGWQVAEVVLVDETSAVPSGRHIDDSGHPRPEEMSIRPSQRTSENAGPMENAKVKWFNRAKVLMSHRKPTRSCQVTLISSWPQLTMPSPNILGDMA